MAPNEIEASLYIGIPSVDEVRVLMNDMKPKPNTSQPANRIKQNNEPFGIPKEKISLMQTA